jgi:thiamine-monophosphate kinase
LQLLTYTDLLLEGVHFRRWWHDPRRLGRKSLAVNISDIAAMGGIPPLGAALAGYPS